ncbi:MAG: cytochrome c [Chloroflexi bacterium]|mgnify:FL=1|jgi:mono/diheme cytochrome c family protein|nr:cytochrome c [Chloroflexota bacterium]MBT4072680.1 cytochrome c [Chloroflexota bacterium]MBT4515255.1 cytochrome c [Chloroflexota bacterium]MBT5320486.1 cytochrome c [Chloroflexota bacterium]MBT6681778.1 cytochrome c [Chloroflexota bacterium]
MISTRLMSLTALFVVGAIFIAACGSDDAEVVPTPVFEPTAAPEADTPVATSAPAEAAPEPTAAPAAATGDAGNGEIVFQGSCSGCHSTGANRVVGPGLSGIGTTAETRVAGSSADEYLTTSIVSPSSFVVEGFSPIMPGTFGDSLSEQEIADVVAYMVSLP